MGWEINTHYGYGAIIKYIDPLKDLYDDPEYNVAGLISGTFMDQCGGFGESGMYVMIKDTTIHFSKDNFGNYPLLIKIPETESYQKALWRDKIIEFCSKNNMDFEEPSWMLATFSG